MEIFSNELINSALYKSGQGQLDDEWDQKYGNDFPIRCPIYRPVAASITWVLLVIDADAG